MKKLLVYIGTLCLILPTTLMAQDNSDVLKGIEALNKKMESTQKQLLEQQAEIEKLRQQLKKSKTSELKNKAQMSQFEQKLKTVEAKKTGTMKNGVNLKWKSGDKKMKLKIYGFSQLEARAGDGVSSRVNESDDSARFSAQRIRLGTSYTAGKVLGKLFIDFNRTHSNKGGGLPETIKDAFVGYNFNKYFNPRLGMIKAPHGMNFTIPGWNLDNIERSGLDKSLVLERDMGLIISGRDIGWGDFGKVNGFEMGHERPWKGFGYDLMVANPAGRSTAVLREDQLGSSSKRRGDALSYIGRIHFDWTEAFHFEASYAISEEAGGRYTRDYESFDIGIDSHLGPLNLKAEYITGENIQGINRRDQQCLTLTGTYMFCPRFEGVIKHYQARADRGDDPTKRDDTDLGNTYLGINLFLEPVTTKMDRKSKRKLQNHRVQLNYVFPSGDDDTHNTEWEGLGGYTDDAWLFQYQYKF